jgi:hypothetical protein
MRCERGLIEKVAVNDFITLAQGCGGIETGRREVAIVQRVAVTRTVFEARLAVAASEKAEHDAVTRLNLGD